MDPRDASWSSVDPKTHSYDPSIFTSIAHRHIVASHTRGKRVTDKRRERILAALKRDIARDCEMWVAGWEWTAGEGDNLTGGPVQSWCCTNHSMLPIYDSEPEETVARFVGAVREWREFLEALDDIFDGLAGDFQEQPLHRATEHAAARLLPLVLKATRSECAWYNTFVAVLRWCLEAHGVESPGLEEVIRETTDGRFLSWIEPDDEMVATTCRLVGAGVSANFNQTPDSLEVWIRTRTQAYADNCTPSLEKETSSVADASKTLGDAHREFIVNIDEQVPSERRRRDRMLGGLEACRLDAAANKPLTFSTLAAWQKHVLEVYDEYANDPRDCHFHARFRTGDAYAKNGRERYKYWPGLKKCFEKALEEANDVSVDCSVRAARVYLDIAFFHPFMDGNARSARLSLDFVLAREGKMLSFVEPLFSIARSPDDAVGALEFAKQIRSNMVIMKV